MTFRSNSDNPERRERYDELFSLIKPTPLSLIQNIPIPNNNRIWVKEEQFHPTESAFDRVYPKLFHLLEQRGDIVPYRTPVVECSLGNAGASFAWAASILGYDATVVTNADTPRARVSQIESFGAKVILSPKQEYGTGYVKVLEEILAKDKLEKGGRMGENLSRLYAVTKIMPEARSCYHSLAEEALEQRRSAGLPGTFDFFVSAVGSGDLISGVSAQLKRFIPTLETIALEPAEIPAISALKDGRVLPYRPLQIDKLMIGVTATGVPAEKLNIDFSVIDRIVPVTTDEWERTDALLSMVEGKQVGRTSAGALAAALSLSQRTEGKDILTVFYDSRWKYGDSLPDDYYSKYRKVI